jgi:hypothetical protein
MYKNFTSLKLLLRTTNMTPVKSQISKCQAEKSLSSELQRITAALLLSIC